jgi:hypothetical protein
MGSTPPPVAQQLGLRFDPLSKFELQDSPMDVLRIGRQIGRIFDYRLGAVNVLVCLRAT